MIYRCDTCDASFQITGRRDQHLLKPSMVCPNQPLCLGKVKPAAAAAGGKITKLSALAFFQATEGLGLPGERQCDMNTIMKALLGGVITELHIEPAGNDRSFITALTVDRTHTIFFAPSTKGVTVYRMTKHV